MLHSPVGGIIPCHLAETKRLACDVDGEEALLGSSGTRGPTDRGLHDAESLLGKIYELCSRPQPRTRRDGQPIALVFELLLLGGGEWSAR